MPALYDRSDDTEPLLNGIAMTAASRSCIAAVALAVAGLLAACTTPGGSGLARSRTTGAATPATSRSAAPAPTSTPRPPIPTASAPSALPPVSSSPDDLGRVDIRGGLPGKRTTTVRLPAASGYSVTVGCIGRAGTLLHWSVIGTTAAYPGFLFGSTSPCNGAFLTDTAMANIEEPTSARLEVSGDPGVEAATVVLRRSPADPHL